MSKVTAKMSVDVSIDLTFYMNAYRSKLSGNPHAVQEFNSIREEIWNELSPNSMKGATLLFRLIEMATEDCVADQALIEKTPAYNFMQDSLGETVKNSIDEAVRNALDSKTESVQAILRVDIEFDKHGDMIAITCTDNGRGFPPTLILTLESCDSRARYLKRRGSDKSTSGVDCFFGGRGRGLRELIAKVDGDVLTRNRTRNHFFNKPQRSELYFFNNGGAGVRVITSTEELTLSAPIVADNEECSFSDDDASSVCSNDFSTMPL